MIKKTVSVKILALICCSFFYSFTETASASGAAREEIKFKSGDVELQGTLTIPESKTPSYCIVIFVGAQPWDRDGNINGGQDYNIYKGLEVELADADLAVFRYDKRGTGKSEGAFTTNIETLKKDAEAGLKYLHSDRGFDKNKIIFLGHSLGTAIAAELAAFKPYAAVLLSPVIPPEKLKQFDCPLLLIKGKEDKSIKEYEFSELSEKAGNLNAASRSIIVPDTGHIFLSIKKAETEDTLISTIKPEVPVGIIDWLNGLE